MKVIILALFASLAIGGAFGGEKESAIEEIKLKYDELFTLTHTVVKHIQDEINKRVPDIVNQTIEYGNLAKKTTLQQFADEVKKVSRTAIVKGKPVSTFECLAKASTEGRQQILDVQEDFIDKVDAVAIARASRLENSMIASALILNAVTELKDQTIKNIEKADSGIQSLKDEALKRIDSGRKQIVNLESSIGKPTLLEEYNKLKLPVDQKYKEVQEALFKRLQRCL